MTELDQRLELADLQRRSLMLAGAGGLLLGQAWPSLAAAANGSGRDGWMDDPARRYQNFLRVTGDLSGRVSPQYWRGVYMGIVPGSQPKILFRLHGCEMKRLFRRSDTECELQYRLFTSFDDPETGEPLAGKRWLNPYTNKEVVVEPNIGSADTIVRLTDRGVVETPRAGGFEGLIHLDWAVQDSTVLMAGHKDRPAATPAPTGEYATHWIDRAAAADFGAPRLEMNFNSTFMMGFRKFLGMPPDSGVTVWHASGIKARAVDELPEAYLRELWRHRPELRDWIKGGS
ncbi:MAG: DUF1838 domain-containing protein [Steroidobacteraceae bacterium]|jgi:hypothetical protein|nr:DUF1838 domain-containing protein [Steroidobacteraceae bacterium]